MGTIVEWEGPVCHVLILPDRALLLNRATVLVVPPAQ
jgi:hypothetical protein